MNVFYTHLGSALLLQATGTRKRLKISHNSVPTIQCPSGLFTCEIYIFVIKHESMKDYNISNNCCTELMYYLSTIRLSFVFKVFQKG